MKPLLNKQNLSRKAAETQKTRRDFLCVPLRLYLALAGCAFVLCFASPVLSQKTETFTNPILAGFYPDPSICRVGSDYYLVTSSFSYYPGIPIFHSKDLANWKQIGHVMDRPEQLDLDGLGVSRGIFAPSIRYHDGMFYVTCTLVDKGGNFLVTSKKAEGPWSNPVWIPEINGIDPSMFFDENGKAYVVYNSIPPDDKPLYDGHRTLRMYEFDVANLKVIGDEILLVNGGVDLSKKPVWIEAPHIFQKNGYYYLIAAEGGTGDQHSEVVFRSKSVSGPYIPYQENPILTQRHLDPKRKNPITSTGHADFVETERGEWWAVFLGCRPYDNDFYNTGRETFLAPVRWQDGWPIINPDFVEVQYHYPIPQKLSAEKSEILFGGNFTFKDEFESKKLSYSWLFLRTPRTQWHSLSQRKGYLAIQLRSETCSENVNPSFLGHRQQHLAGTASVAFDFSPKAEHEKAGLLIFQNEKHFYFLCKSVEGNKPVVQLYQSSARLPQMELLAFQPLDETHAGKELLLKIEARRSTYSFFYALSPNEWTLLKDEVDAKFLSTKVAGGFVGCVYALYATSLGKPSDNTAYFDWFEYRGDDEVYRRNSP
ncbi:glycoside hydrolase family 43 protein [bacterium]|nr:glycoside hydrolase family 43 protein [bacterium]